MIGCPAAAALVAALIAAPAQAAAAAEPWKPSKPSAGAVKGVKDLKPEVAQQVSQAQRAFTPHATTWPAAAKSSAHVLAPSEKSDGARQVAAGTPVWLQAPKSEDGAHQGPSDIGVSVFDHQKAAALGVSGVVFTVDPSSATSKSKVRVGVDYSAFAEAFGGNYASRLHLVTLPACALTTPDVAACRVQTPLATQQDPKTTSVSAEVELGQSQVEPSTSASNSNTVPATFSSNDSAVLKAASMSSLQVLAATTSDDQGGSAAGSYAAGSLAPSGSWSSGSSSGAFTYAYPIQAPGATTSVVPAIELTYDSASVDGKTASTQAQASWVGDGWSTPDSYIEQTFTSCTDQPEGSASPSETGDQCYAGPILTLSLNGTSTALVWDSGKSTWKPQSDNGEKIAHITGSNNGTGTYNTDYWALSRNRW
ncbi:hypothetical protein Kpho01_76450 [Kitasatospora phosalacinea]|uniref:Uncharacterized protein n=2 Tax=Kitasatospora phosalacinea TaxID=2065 RepID=A0A9W6PQS7_9ACTN|nr:hypothetical protein Kpho01_76450 [Kitasatospora phosalacinea]